MSKHSPDTTRESDLMQSFRNLTKGSPEVHAKFRDILANRGIEIKRDNKEDYDIYRIDGGKWRRVDDCIYLFLVLLVADCYRQNAKNYKFTKCYSDCISILSESEIHESIYMISFLDFKEIKILNKAKEYIANNDKIDNPTLH